MKVIKKVKFMIPEDGGYVCLTLLCPEKPSTSASPTVNTFVLNE